MVEEDSEIAGVIWKGFWQRALPQMRELWWRLRHRLDLLEKRGDSLAALGALARHDADGLVARAVRRAGSSRRAAERLAALSPISHDE